MASKTASCRPDGRARKGSDLLEPQRRNTYEPLRHQTDTIGAECRATTLWLDIAEERNDQKCLLRTVKEMNKEIPIVVPIRQLTEIKLIISAILRPSKIGDERVSPALPSVLRTSSYRPI